MAEHLFNDYDLRGVLEGQTHEMKQAIARYDADRFLNTAVEVLVAYFVELGSIEPVSRHEQVVNIPGVGQRLSVSLLGERLI